MKILDLIKILDDEDNLITIKDFITEEELFTFWSSDYYSDDLSFRMNSIIETFDVKTFGFNTDRYVIYIEIPEVQIRDILENLYEREKD